MGNHVNKKACEEGNTNKKTCDEGNTFKDKEKVNPPIHCI